jgi:hypothetical protein
MFSVPKNKQQADDIPSTFYDGGGNSLVGIPVVPEVAMSHQRTLTNLIKHGDPNIGAKVPELSKYDVGREIGC